MLIQPQRPVGRESGDTRVRCCFLASGDARGLRQGARMKRRLVLFVLTNLAVLVAAAAPAMAAHGNWG